MSDGVLCGVRCVIECCVRLLSAVMLLDHAVMVCCSCPGSMDEWCTVVSVALNAHAHVSMCTLEQPHGCRQVAGPGCTRHTCWHAGDQHARPHRLKPRASRRCANEAGQKPQCKQHTATRYSIKDETGEMVKCAFFRRQLAEKLGVPNVRLLWAETQEEVSPKEWA